MKLTIPQTEILVRLGIALAVGNLRDPLVVEAHRSGVSKNMIHRCTGIGRPTIDRILEREARKNMNTIWDVIRRLLESRPLTELEQRLAHDIISAHEAASTPEHAAEPAPDPAEIPAG